MTKSNTAPGCKTDLEPDPLLARGGKWTQIAPTGFSGAQPIGRTWAVRAKARPVGPLRDPVSALPPVTLGSPDDYLDTSCHPYACLVNQSPSLSARYVPRAQAQPCGAQREWHDVPCARLRSSRLEQSLLKDSCGNPVAEGLALW